MKINKFFQKCFKVTFQKLFILFYGEVKNYNKHNNLDFKKSKIESVFLKNNTEYNVSNYIYEIPNGRVYTDTVEHVAVIKDNIIIPEISTQQVKGELKKTMYNKVLSSGTPRLIKNVDGTMLSLVQGASGNNYFHFLFDIVAKLKLCKVKLPLKNIDFFYVPGDSNWQKTILNLFEIDDKKIINSEIYRHVKAKKIIAIDHPWYQKGYVQEEIKNLPPWIIFWLREKFLNLSKRFSCSNKIFIDRSESKFNHCKLINNSEIIEYLSKKGFKSYQVGKLDFFEQIYLFNQAKIIIGPHGAAFSNIIFSNPGTNLIEIITENHPSKKCERLSNFLNLNYTRVEKEKIYENDNIPGDMKIETEEINNILKKIGIC